MKKYYKPYFVVRRLKIIKNIKEEKIRKFFKKSEIILEQVSEHNISEKTCPCGQTLHISKMLREFPPVVLEE